MAKKQAKKAGRPPLPEGERLGKGMSLRFAEDHEAMIRKAAEATGTPPTVFVRDAAVEKARRVLGLER